MKRQGIFKLSFTLLGFCYIFVQINNQEIKFEYCVIFEIQALLRLMCRPQLPFGGQEIIKGCKSSDFFQITSQVITELLKSQPLGWVGGESTGRDLLIKGTRAGFGGTRSFSFSLAGDFMHLCLVYCTKPMKSYLKLQHVLTHTAAIWQ